MNHKLKIFSFLIIFALFTFLISIADPIFALSSGKEFDDVSGEKHYNYCPSYIQTDASTRYVFYCRNPESGKIVDSVFIRKATRNGSSWTWGPQREVLEKSTGWESVHVCDPEVRKGEFKMNGETYDWVMFYLGCDQLDNNHNQIGVAFAKNIEGPWEKWQGNPLIEFPGTADWGVGQPSATCVDGKGEMLLFYTRGDRTGTRIQYRHIDISDMSSPDLGTETNLFKDGLHEKDGTYAIFHNAGFAYDAQSDRFYVVRERHPYESLLCNFISSEVEVAYTSGQNIWNNSGTWIQDGLVNPDNTGKPRNHNPGLLTGPYGDPTGGASGYRVVFSTADFFSEDSGIEYLWTYRIHSISRSELNTTSKIDDRNQGIHYSGEWESSETRSGEYYLKTSKWSSEKGADARLSFRGGEVSVYGIKSPSGGHMNVYIDGLVEDVINTYSAQKKGPVLLYKKSGLQKGFHMLTLEVSGSRDSASSGTVIELDHFIVDSSESSFAQPTNSPQPTTAEVSSQGSTSVILSSSSESVVSEILDSSELEESAIASSKNSAASGKQYSEEGISSQKTSKEPANDNGGIPAWVYVAAGVLLFAAVLFIILLKLR